MLIEVTRFCKRHGIGEGDFGQRSVGDRGLLNRIRRGTELQPRTIEKIKAFMAEEEKQNAEAPRDQRSTA